MKSATVTRACRYQGAPYDIGQVVVDHDVADKLVRLGFATRDPDKIAEIAAQASVRAAADMSSTDPVDGDPSTVAADDTSPAADPDGDVLGDVEADSSEPAAPASKSRRARGDTQEA